MHSDRRDVLRLLLAGGLSLACPNLAGAEPIALRSASPSGQKWRQFELANGLRVHLLANDTGYVSGSLLLRSDRITPENGGLAHILEHTSFTGAAGSLSAQDVKELHKDVIQDSNASTRAGAIEWQVSFLPDSLSEALGILSMTSLDQRFDEATVKSEANVVLQELYLDKYGKAGTTQKRFLRALYGKDHPHSLDTVEKEIAMAKTPPAKLAAKLRAYAEGLRLPGNMDLILAGGFDMDAAEAAAQSAFGVYPSAKGPLFDFPRVPITRGYEKLAGPSHDLSQPMCEVTLAWNTGVCVRDPEARVLMALCEYLSGMLFLQLREQRGETYVPEISYEPDGCSGVFNITVTSSAAATQVEHSIFSAMEHAKQTIDQREVARFKSRAKLKRVKSAGDNMGLVQRKLEIAVDGASADDFEIETVTADEILLAAQRYLPAHKSAYVRLTLLGQ
jgi:predicted Zn-dependent peptidase